MTNSTPEDGEPTSFAEKTKNWHERHKLKIRVALGVTLAVGLSLIAAAHRPERQDGERYDAEDIEEWQPISDRNATDKSRQSALDPDRDPFLRRLPAGQQAGETAKDMYRQLTDNDLPPGSTLVSRWSYLSLDDDAPGEAAA